MTVERRVRRASAGLLATVGMAAFATAPVRAQEATLPQLDPVTTPIIEEGGVELDVTRRHRSEFDPRGIPVGSWTLLPSVAAHLGYDSNLYGAQMGKRSGGFVEVEPAIGLRSNFSGGSVTMQADGRFRRFFDQSPADETSYNAALDGRYDVSGTASLDAGGSFGQLIERRDSSGFPDGVVEPVRFLQANGYVRGRYEPGNLRAIASIDYTHFDFRDATTIGADGTATRLDQRVRNHGIARANLNTAYAITPDLGIFVQGTASMIRYSRAEIAPGIPNLDANDYTALVGVTLGRGQIMRGSIGVGYNWRDYKAGSLGHIGGIAFSADLKYFMTPLVTISITGSRTLEEAVVQNAAAGPVIVTKASGLVDTVVSMRADYELLRPLILNAGVTVRRANFRNDPRRDTVIEASVGATHHMSRALALDVSASYLDRKVRGDPNALSYDDFNIRLGVRLSL
ncbi:outer membrane beta-barrel protein [Sphingomonas oryzagri]|uniref:Outer membrane beta-barrel protein n=1 Tax=Sphingomonas oryzagri TaxID=3042314 RepID=A0ABT6N2A3_9SPHN|nr:outer membrane beta-barrel protein [Sphingomonas oryzagri]MDH7639193.1 outer membrane beta-barrel protein [Sphingomonas oryzagri]